MPYIWASQVVYNTILGYWEAYNTINGHRLTYNTIYGHYITTHHIHETIWIVLFRINQEQEAGRFESLLLTFVQSGKALRKDQDNPLHTLIYPLNPPHVTILLKGSGTLSRLSRLGSSIRSLVAAEEDAQEMSEVSVASTEHRLQCVTSECLPYKTSVLSEMTLWCSSFLSLLPLYAQHRALSSSVELVAAADDGDWTLLSTEHDRRICQFYREVLKNLLDACTSIEVVCVELPTLPQLGQLSKEKLRTSLAKLILVLFTPRLDRSDALYTLQVIAPYGTLLKTLDRSYDKFLQRLHTCTLHLMTDKQELDKEMTNAAATMLEICQGSGGSRVGGGSSTDTMAAIHAWNETDHNAHQTWLVTQEHAGAKIGEAIVILNKSINAHAEIVTNAVFNQQVGALRSFAAKSRAPPFLRIIIAPSFQLQSKNDSQIRCKAKE
eukprot:sb/3479711/